MRIFAKYLDNGIIIVKSLSMNIYSIGLWDFDNGIIVGCNLKQNRWRYLVPLRINAYHTRLVRPKVIPRFFVRFFHNYSIWKNACNPGPAWLLPFGCIQLTLPRPSRGDLSALLRTLHTVGLRRHKAARAMQTNCHIYIPVSILCLVKCRAPSVLMK